MKPWLAVGLGAGALGTWLAVHVGWLDGSRPWIEATGFAAIPRTDRPTASFAGFRSGAPVLRWLGHSGFLVEWHGRRVLLDPDLSDRCTIARRVLERPVAPSDLGAIDAVLISHAHYDHLDLPTLRGIPSIGRILVPQGDEVYLAGHGLSAAIDGLAPWTGLRVGDLELIAVPAAHNGNRHHPLASAKHASGWIVRAGDDAVYYAGDTGRDNDFAAIARAYRPVLAILPIGAYAPTFPMRRYHLSPEDAVAVARSLGVRHVVPCHFGTFALALDRPAAALPRFARAARRAGLEWSMPILLRRSAGPHVEGAS